jgi:pyruvyl transferase EpsO
MVALRDKVGEIADLIPRAHSVVFLDYPVYLNVGDLLIEKGTEAFFKSFGYDVTTIRSAHDFPPTDPAAIDPQATIVLQGGGNFGDLYDLHQRFRERVVGTYRKNRIVLMPQTIYFESPDRLAECVAVFSAHPDLHVCVRDRASYTLFRRYFPNPVYLFPDMAHFLWDELAAYRSAAGKRATLFFRRADKEDYPIADGNAGEEQPIDWRDVITLPERGAFMLLYRLHLHHNRILPRHEIYPLWRVFRDRLTRKAASTLARYERVVTNRLHVALLGLLTGRQVDMADNFYGKLSAYYSCWLVEIPAINLLGRPAPEERQRTSAPAAG